MKPIRDQVFNYLMDHGPSDPVTICRALGLKYVSVKSILLRHRDVLFVKVGKKPRNCGQPFGVWSAYELE